MKWSFVDSKKKLIYICQQSTVIREIVVVLLEIEVENGPSIMGFFLITVYRHVLQIFWQAYKTVIS